MKKSEGKPDWFDVTQPIGYVIVALICVGLPLFVVIHIVLGLIGW